jgi:hypothetical protein
LVVENTEKTEIEPDFGRGLFVCQKPGLEFAGTGSAGLAIGFIGTQVFAMMFLVPVIGFFVMRNLMGVPAWVAGVIAGVISVGVVGVGLVFLMKINKGNRKQGAHFMSESDSRYRVRAVIPNKRRDGRVMQWAQHAAQGAIGDGEMVSEDELAMVRGGFEPMVVRPWFGIKRDRKYWWTFVVMFLVVGLSAVYMLGLLFGGAGSVFSTVGFMGYALIGLAAVGGALGAELIWPVYVRLVPGQLDFFRYGFLGSGEPVVESIDLRTVGVCVDFGGYMISLEPARAVGEPLPALVMGKRWPYGKTFPEDYQPIYFSATLVRNRREFAQRLVQAARTDEPTPAVSMERLGE